MDLRDQFTQDLRLALPYFFTIEVQNDEWEVKVFGRKNRLLSHYKSISRGNSRKQPTRDVLDPMRTSQYDPTENFDVGEDLKQNGKTVIQLYGDSAITTAEYCKRLELLSHWLLDADFLPLNW